jgi:glutamate--cysteine ligase
LRSAHAALADAGSVPSARVLETMTKEFDGSYVRFVSTLSEQEKAGLLAMPFPADVQARLAGLAERSIDEQKAIEAADTVPFEVYRRQYLSSERLGL